jgi:hypothetical protein
MGWMAGVAGSIIAPCVRIDVAFRRYRGGATEHPEGGAFVAPERPVKPFQIVELQLNGDDTTFKVGEPIRCTIRVTNAGEQAGNGCHVSATPRHEEDDFRLCWGQFENLLLQMTEEMDLRPVMQGFLLVGAGEALLERKNRSIQWGPRCWWWPDAPA